MYQFLSANYGEMAFAGNLAAGTNPFRALDARLQILLAFGFVCVTVSTPSPNPLAFLIYAGLLLWTAGLCGIRARRVFFRALAVLPFSVLAALWLPFLPGGETVNFLGGGVTVSVAGLWLLFGVAAKSYLGAAAAVLLGQTLGLGGAVAGLRGLHVPPLFADLLALTCRYLYVLREEALNLRLAAAARGYRPRWLGQAYLIGRLAGQLFLRSHARAERVHQAMLLRGYAGGLPAAPVRARSGGEIAIALVAALLLAGVRWLFG